VSQHPSSGVLKTVSATSGISHGTGTATSFHRGLIKIDLNKIGYEGVTGFILLRMGTSGRLLSTGNKLQGLA